MNTLSRPHGSSCVLKEINVLCLMTIEKNAKQEESILHSGPHSFIYFLGLALFL
jgi:hypothetical protein